MFCCENQRENCFCHGEAPDWAFWRASATVSSGKNRSNIIRSIDFEKNSIDQLLSSIDRLSGTSEFPSISSWNFAIPLVLIYKTQKLTKISENSNAKGLTNVNQWVQIYNIWYSSENNDTLRVNCIFYLFLFLSLLLRLKIKRWVRTQTKDNTERERALNVTVPIIKSLYIYFLELLLNMVLS